MFNANLDIRNALAEAKRKNGIKTWQVASQLGVHETTFYRWMRHELPDSKKKQIFKAIEDIERELKQREA